MRLEVNIGISARLREILFKTIIQYLSYLKIILRCQNLRYSESLVYSRRIFQESKLDSPVAQSGSITRNSPPLRSRSCKSRSHTSAIQPLSLSLSLSLSRRRPAGSWIVRRETLGRHCIVSDGNFYRCLSDANSTVIIIRRVRLYVHCIEGGVCDFFRQAELGHQGDVDSNELINCARCRVCDPSFFFY